MRAPGSNWLDCRLKHPALAAAAAFLLIPLLSPALPGPAGAPEATARPAVGAPPVSSNLDFGVPATRTTPTSADLTLTAKHMLRLGHDREFWLKPCFCTTQLFIFWALRCRSMVLYR